MLTPEERQDLACLAEHYGYGIHRCYAGDNPPLFAAVERIRDEAVEAAARALVEQVEFFYAFELARLTTGDCPETLKVPMIGNYLGGISTTATELRAALAARPDVRGEGEG